MMKKSEFNSLDIVSIIKQSYDLVNHTNNTMRSVKHDSLIIWPTTNSFNWFSRGIGGGPEVWLKYVLNLSKEEIDEYLNDYTFKREYKYDLTPEVEVVFPIGQKTYSEYMRKRGISKETAEFFELEVLANDVIIPLYNTRSERIGSMIRRTDTNKNWQKYRKIINGEMCGLWNKTTVHERYDKQIIIFEGAWSVMRWWQVSRKHGIDIAPLGLLSTGVKNALPLIYNIQNAVFVLDRDENDSGLSVYKRAVRHKGMNDWKFYIPPIYPDEMNDKQILKMLKIIMD